MKPMTEPKELRSIDELFRNAFNNLPDTPASSAWDAPSDHVWQHIRENISAPRVGWNMPSPSLLAGFAVAVAVGFYIAFSNPGKVENKAAMPPSLPMTAVDKQPPVEAKQASKSQSADALLSHTVPAATFRKKISKVANNTAVVTVDVPSKVLNTETTATQTAGALPLPGTKSAALPNTTEELKAARARQLALIWSTPVQILPVPSKANVKQ
jgi:hypothetical protein